MTTTSIQANPVKRKEHGPYNFTSDNLPGLSKLIEECGEVVQVAAKLIATNGEAIHWDGSNLYDRLEEELGDLYAAIDFVIGGTRAVRGINIAQRCEYKSVLFRKWHQGE